MTTQEELARQEQERQQQATKQAGQRAGPEMLPGRSPFADIAKAEREAGVPKGTYAPRKGATSAEVAVAVTRAQGAAKAVKPPFKPTRPAVSLAEGPPMPEYPAFIPEVKIPKQAKIETRTAAGAPEFYKYKGERFYAPDSQMHKMGFRTWDEYSQAQRHGVKYGIHPGEEVPESSALVPVKIVRKPGAKPEIITLRYSGEKPSVKRAIARDVLLKVGRGLYSVSVQGFDRKGNRIQVLLPRDIAADLASLKGKPQFQRYKRLGIIPRESLYVIGKDDVWSFTIPPPKPRRPAVPLAEGPPMPEYAPPVIPTPKTLAEKPPVGPPVVKPPDGPVPIPTARQRIIQRVLGGELLTHTKPATSAQIEQTAVMIKSLIGKYEDFLTEVRDLPKPLQDLKEEIAKLPPTQQLAKWVGVADQHLLQDWKRQEAYLKFATDFNTAIEDRNTRVDALNKEADALIKRGDAISLKNIEALNKRADELEKLEATLDPADAEAVNAFNKQIDAYNRDVRKATPTFKAIDDLNRDIAKYDRKVAQLEELGELPEAPPASVGGFTYLAIEGTKQRFKDATAKDLPLQKKAGNITNLVAEMIVPGLWARHWGEMGWVGKGVNIGLDLLILIPLAKLATIGVKSVVSPVGKFTLKRMMAQEAKQLKITLKIIRQSYGKVPAQSLRAVARAQGSYVLRLRRLRQLEAAGKKAAGQKRIVARAEARLKQSANKFVDDMKKAGASADDPITFGRLTALPKEIVDHSKGVVDAFMKPKAGQTLKQAKAALAKAEIELKSAQAKFPTAPGKWSDLVADVLIKNARITQLQSGSLEKMYFETLRLHNVVIPRARKLLTETRQAIRDLEKIAVKDMSGAQVQALAVLRAKEKSLAKEIIRLGELRTKMVQDVHTNLRTLEVDWGRGGAISTGGSRIATLTRARPRVRRRPDEPAIAEAASRGATGTSLKTILQTLTGLGASILIAAGRPLPGLEKIFLGAVEPEQVRALTTATIKGLRTALDMKTAGKTAPEIAAGVRAAVEASAKVALSTKAAEAIKAKVDVITKVAVKVPVKVPPKVPRKPRPKLRIGGASDEEKRKVIKESKGGAVTWNMGKLGGKDVWHTRLDTGQHLIVLGKPPEGARILADGPGSASKTTQRIGSQQPFKEITQHHGAVRATVLPSKAPKGASIRFTPHRTRTSSQTRLKSVKRGKIYYTPASGSTLMSRRPLGRRRR